MSPGTWYAAAMLAALSVTAAPAAVAAADRAAVTDVPGRPPTAPDVSSLDRTVPPASAPPRLLRVEGEGRAQAAPDTVLVTAAVTVVDASLGRATRDASERARRIVETLAAAGVASADVQTARYDVQIERRVGKGDEAPRIAGYRVTNELRFKVRALPSLGAILDRVVAAGANEVQGLAFAKEDLRPEQSQALAAAVRAAREKAEAIARAAGVRVGEVLEISEGDRATGPIPMQGRTMALASAVPVEPGQLEVTAHVAVVFALR